MLDLSGYNMKKNVHIFKQGGEFIAYDVNSGSLHRLDEAAYAVLQALLTAEERGLGLNTEVVGTLIGSSLSAVEIEEILRELALLQEEGTLFSPEAEAKGPVYPPKPLVKAICLHVAHDCNLRCEYCFAGTGAFGGNRELMDLETGKRAIDFVLEASGHRSHCEVDFFGGEPLLNFSVVKELVHYGKTAAAELGKSIKFTLTTNAVLLNEEVQNFLEAEDISVVLSLDGRPEVHDRMRPYANGRGSYDKVVPAIQKFVQKHPESSPYAIGTYYYVRGTYTHFNLDFDRDVAHMLDLGIERISLEPVVASAEEPYAFQPEDIEVIKESYDRLGEEIVRRRAQGEEFSFFHFNTAFEQGPCLPKRLSGCGAGHEYVAISPEGDIYPCHQFVGQEQYKLGSLYAEEPLALKPSLVEAFRSAHVYAKPSCRECWARFACSGGCHAANSAATGKLTEVYALGCEFQKKRLEVAFYLKIKEVEQGKAAADSEFLPRY